MRCQTRSSRLSTPQIPATLPTSFANSSKTDDGSNAFWSILWKYLSTKVQDKVPTSALPVLPMDFNGSGDAVWRICHSTVLLRLDGQYLLTDPVFATRASPLSFAGPKRFHQLPISLDALPPLAAVLLSHDHYDHLDKSSIAVLKHKTAKFVVPLGVDRHLHKLGVPAEQITVLDWWQQTQIAGIRVHATPAQHFSGRSLFDKNQTLWASYVIETSQHRLFFSGDTGYFSGFAEIARRFGHFDLAMIETGAYDELWPDIHLQPEQSLRAHLDLKADYLLPIHNSSFALALHSWYEPLVRLANAADAYQVSLLTPLFGQQIQLDALADAASKNLRWWQPWLPAQTLASELQIPA